MGFSLKNEIPFAFFEFSRLCKAENFPLRLAAAVDWRSRSSQPTIHVNARVGSSRIVGGRGPRVAPCSSAQHVPRPEPRAQAKSGFLPHLRVFKALQGGKFPMRRQPRSPPPRDRRAAMAGSGYASRRLARDALSRSCMRASARRRAARCRDLNAVVAKHASTPQSGGEIGHPKNPSMNSFSQKENFNKKIDSDRFRETAARGGPSRARRGR
jgi:hypothetical protein